MEEKRLTLRENLASLDRLQFFSVLALFFLGVTSIFSAGAGFDGRGSGFAARQLLWGCLSASAFLGCSRSGMHDFSPGPTASIPLPLSFFSGSWCSG